MLDTIAMWFCIVLTVGVGVPILVIAVGSAMSDLWDATKVDRRNRAARKGN